MEHTGAGDKKIFLKVDQIHIADMNIQAHDCFGLIGNRNFNTPLKKPLVVKDLQNLAINTKEVKNFFYRVQSYMITKAIEGLITRTSLNKIRLHQREYGWSDGGGFIRNEGTAMVYIQFKIINPDKIISVLNLKYEIEKATLDKFDTNVKYLLDGMSSNYTIIIDQGERNDYYVCHLLRDLFSGPNSNINGFI